MAADSEMETMVKTLLQARVLAAFNETPELVNKLLEAALSKPVDSNGRTDGYIGDKKPFLDYLVGNEIRQAAERAVREIVKESQPLITEIVRKRLNSEDIVESFVSHILGAAKEDWKITVKFEAEKDKRY